VNAGSVVAFANEHSTRTILYFARNTKSVVLNYHVSSMRVIPCIVKPSLRGIVNAIELTQSTGLDAKSGIVHRINA
jgi:hypothetical protein